MESAGDDGGTQMVDFNAKRRGSSVAEQLIRNPGRARRTNHNSPHLPAKDEQP